MIAAQLDLLHVGAVESYVSQPVSQDAEYQSSGAGTDKYSADVIHVATTVSQAKTIRNIAEVFSGDLWSGFKTKIEAYRGTTTSVNR